MQVVYPVHLSVSGEQIHEVRDQQEAQRAVAWVRDFDIVGREVLHAALEAGQPQELAADADGEHAELAAIYVGRGLTPALAHDVATQLMAKDALGAHARDELGISDTGRARPVQAALASALAFAAGALLPLLVAVLAPAAWRIPAIGVLSLACLTLLGGVAARVGGAKVYVGALRVTLLGAFAMGLTLAVGSLVGRLSL